MGAISMDDAGTALVERCREVLHTARASEPSVTYSPALPDPTAIARVVDELLGHHDDPGRHHHARHHLVDVLSEIDRLVSIDLRWWRVPPAVELAVMFHDVVYDPTRTDNERRSADVADTTLSELGVATTLRDEVVRLVRLTATHDPTADDPAGQLLTDGDLWILAAPPARYDRYVDDVRAEYGHLDDGQWRTGRVQVLSQLTDLVDRHGYFVGPCEDRARRSLAALDNMQRELNALATASG